MRSYRITTPERNGVRGHFSFQTNHATLEDALYNGREPTSPFQGLRGRLTPLYGPKPTAQTRCDEEQKSLPPVPISDAVIGAMRYASEIVNRRVRVLRKPHSLVVERWDPPRGVMYYILTCCTLPLLDL
ncbi:hypothetical protein AVEN_152939-1 [Araneus ventricosus]|uniref:Uncharacterized protein n=1 Tax=Araneus ventricosus TaxID=182803 RepID=A0A4Y2ACZ0_ARAVE|nr:hypothetical protein AVEN_152939-1 [Araneus ventricosus]